MKLSKVKEFDFEQWLRDQIDWEDPDSALLFNITENDQIAISDYNGGRIICRTNNERI